MTREYPVRRLVAVFAADVAGYSRLTSADEEGTHARLREHLQDLFAPNIAAHRGTIVKNTGDGLLAEFDSVVDSVRCAVDVQHGMAERNATVPPNERIEFRIGINVGDVIRDAGDIFGDVVNVAVRLEAIAEPGGICLSDDAYRHVPNILDVAFDDAGQQRLKNIERSIRVFRVRDRVSAPKRSLALALPDKPSIAVLPFQNMSGDPEQEYFADGIVEDIITALSRFKSLFVIARNSSFTYKGRAVDVKQVGRELGVRYVLEGSVRKAANRVRITGQLIDTVRRGHLWADRFDGGLTDIFDLQDQVTESIVGAIAPAVEKAEIERAKRKPTESLDAYDHYLRGLACFYQPANRQANEEALRLFYAAIELDPDFASAYGLAASCYVDAKYQAWIAGTPDEIVEVSRLARRAVELGKDDAIAIAAGGWALAYVARDLDTGGALVDRALLLNSNCAEAWSFGGWLKLWLGEPEAAIERFTRAIRLNPLDKLVAGMRAGTAHAHFFLGRYDEAKSWAALALQLNPNHNPALRIGAASDAMAGRLEQAQKTIVRLQQVYPTLRISNLKEVLGPYRRAEDPSRYEEGLRRAGLPE